MNEVTRGHSNSRPALRPADAGEEPRLHGGDCADPRAWYRSEHRDFFRSEQRAASPPGLPRVATALLDPSHLVTDGEVLSLDSREPAWFPDLAEGLPFLRGPRDRRGRERRPDGRGGGRRDPRCALLGQPLRRVRRPPGARAQFSARGG